MKSLYLSGLLIAQCAYDLSSETITLEIQQRKKKRHSIEWKAYTCLHDTINAPSFASQIA